MRLERNAFQKWESISKDAEAGKALYKTMPCTTCLQLRVYVGGSLISVK